MLAVYGLERKTAQSAAEHLRRLVDEIKTRTKLSAEDENVFKALQIRPADPRNALDYAYLSLNQEVIPQPRADLLQALRKSLIEAYPDIRVLWRTHAGLDKTRRLTFSMDGQKQAQEIAPKLNEWLERKGYQVLTTYTSRASGTWRITYDFIDPSHVEAIYASPPVIAGRTLYPSRPRFIIPSYGYQIAILGCRDWQSAKGTLNKFVRQLCQRDDGLDPIVHSRMELGGDVYTAVLRDWDSTVKVAEGSDALRDFLSSHVVGRHINPVPQPGLLYGLNGSGLFFRQGPNDRDHNSSEIQQLRHELDAVRQQGLEHIQTLFSSLARTNEAIATMGTRLDHSLAAMTSLAAQQTLDAQVLQLELSMSDLRQERNQCQLVLLLGDRVPEDMKQHNLARMRECEEELDDRRRQIEDLRKQRGAVAFNASASLAAGGPPMITPPPAQEQPRVVAETEGSGIMDGPPASTPQANGDLNMEITPVSLACSSPPPPDPDGHLHPGPSSEPRAQRACAASGYDEAICCPGASDFEPPFLSPPFPSLIPKTRTIFATHAPTQIRLPSLLTNPAPFRLLLALLCFTSLFTFVSASNTLTALTINCNGLANVAKQNAVSNMIAAHNPHIWVINETKSSHPMRDRIRAPEYNKFESVGCKLERGRAGKWGVIVGVKRCLHVQRLETDPRFQGRIVALIRQLRL
ncbi:hypothetical protein OH76DRAFT_1487072 [Lentinus brumalis]|uniref:Endonuclease/exonuclease/phosphatase domain-containing protein n=1 Tax=Lentinus brumalis TaxID=2498619 RepID=A0A371CW41_9APHY|nr:hypothetical protein OH76DRAFT_1487072 [Polyporus brumalis]